MITETSVSESGNPRQIDLLVAVALLVVERMKMNFVVDWRMVERESEREKLSPRE